MESVTAKIGAALGEKRSFFQVPKADSAGLSTGKSFDRPGRRVAAAGLEQNPSLETPKSMM
jgi:hypothetical protein